MEPVSRTQKKNQAKALQALGDKLIQLAPDKIATLNLPEEIYEAVTFAKTIKKHGALKRHMKHIGAMLRECDAEPIQTALDKLETVDYQQVRVIKEIEKWREELISGNTKLMEDILIQYPDVDRQEFSRLIQNAQKEVTDNSLGKAYRTLFRYLKKLRS